MLRHAQVPFFVRVKEPARASLNRLHLRFV